MRSPILLYVLLAAIGYSLVTRAAQTSAGSSQGAKHESVGWQASPTRRGTLNIIENCVFTILACTWSIQYLNLPALKHGRWAKIWRRVKWTVLTIFLPEFIMAHAIVEFVMALDSLESMSGLEGVKVPCDEWFWALPCFRRKRQKCCGKASGSDGEEQKPNEHKPREPKDDDGSSLEVIKWTLTHSYFGNMGGFHLFVQRDEFNPESINKMVEQFSLGDSKNRKIIELCPLTTTQFAGIWKDIKRFQLSEEEIKDKSKADFFTKAIALVQISSLLFSVIARATRHLAISQLELVTLAFAACGVLTYFFRWYKPQGIETVTKVWLSNSHNKWDTILGLRVPKYDRFWQILTNTEKNFEPNDPWRIPNDYLPRVRPQTMHNVLYLLAIITMAFGSIHLIAWNFEFPTPVERILWRTAALVSVSLPPITLVVIPLFQIYMRRGDTQSFMGACLRATRECAWNASDPTLYESYQRLADIYSRPEDIALNHYGDCFNESQLLKILEFIKRRPSEFPEEFLRQFALLLDVIQGMGTSKYHRDADRVHLFPRKNLLLLRILLLTTSIIYCLARLSVIALAFTTLRRMPDSVYETTWAIDIPNVQ